jgi:hypothetical protein
MAEKIASLYAEIYADTTKLDKGLKGTKDKLEDTEKTTKKTQASFGDFAKTLAVVAGAAMAVGAAMKKAFEFTRQGAQVIQTERAFASMAGTIDMSTDVLDDWSDAVNGTISDMQLMTGFQTLAAGLSKEMTAAFADSNVELLKIAKAASALNPQLGDTAYMYESITRGIKRNSPLILDNLGIVVKVGEANEKMADKLGKSVDALTAEEKQMALLNETLKSGDRLIEQLGGSVESATDPWDRFTTAIKNATDQQKKQAAETGIFQKVLGGIADEINDRTKNQGLLNEALEKGAISQEEYNDIARKAKMATRILSDDVEYLEKKVGDTDKATQLAADYGMSALTIKLFEAGKTSKEAANELLNLGYITEEQAQKWYGLALATEEYSAISKDMFTGIIGLAGDFTDIQEEIDDKQNDIKTLMELEGGYGYFDGAWLSADEVKTKIAELTGEVQTLEAQMIESTQQMVWSMMMASVDFTTTTEEELNTLFDTGIALGIFTEESLGLVAQNLGTVWGDIEKDAGGTKSSILGMLNAINNYRFSDKSFTITTYQKTVIQRATDTSIKQQQAAGGFYNTSSPTLFESSEHGQNETAIFIPRGKTLYDVATPAQINNIMPGNENGNDGNTRHVINNYYLTANYPMQSELTVIQELKLMEMAL